ncbi:MAG: nucleotidyl transferase AbiEii/AbiGii toxin family protein [Candidatus Bathyarchaeota archaeon]|nr:nucleotidyl transferase AbiEii/AbiGii toxin family protein [Candidatus Bathyarchaeota archaeon]
MSLFLASISQQINFPIVSRVSLSSHNWLRVKGYIERPSRDQYRLSEKIRSLFQRTRPRDLYDVWKLSKLGLDVSEILTIKFDSKGIDLDIPELFQCSISK